MKCPKCTADNHCGCKSCHENFPIHLPKLDESNGEDDVKCGACDYSMSIYNWYRIADKEYDEKSRLGVP